MEQKKISHLKKKGLLIGSACVSALALSFFCASIATDNWVSASATAADISLSVHYGLFKGVNDVRKIVKNQYVIYVVCDPGQNSCIYSCGSTEEERQEELASALNGSFVPLECTAKDGSKVDLIAVAPSVDAFMNYGLWISTVVFLAFTIAFSGITFLCTVYNAVGNPINTIVGPQGLYLWNAVTITVSLLPLGLWAGQLVAYLSQDVMVSTSLNGDISTKGAAQMDYSYWLILGGALCHIINVPLVRFRNILRDPPPVVKGEEDEEHAGGAILLF